MYPDDFWFHIGKLDNITVVYIEWKSHWEDNKCLNDGLPYAFFESKEISDILNKFNLVRIMDATFENHGEFSDQELRNHLLMEGFDEDSEFSKFIKDHED